MCVTIVIVTFLLYGVLGMGIGFRLMGLGKDGVRPIGLAVWRPDSYSERGKRWLTVARTHVILAPIVFLILVLAASARCAG